MTEGERDPLLLPAKVAFQRIGIGRDSGYQAVREGRLRVVRIGRKVLIPAAEVAAFVEREAGSQSA